MVPHFAYAFQCFVAGEHAELGSLKVAAEVFENPNIAAGLQIKRILVSFRVGRSSDDIRDGSHGTVRLLVFEGGAKPVDGSVTLHVKLT